ncbi:hypothetical protein AGOR_G00190720 [Albula goreensis]|uniref:Uncharacterized protein n=1 Tax=Albula goreensis TaxID=1534307 RepID=A0A8T3CUV4_9TELE|nr:hypothetical protein AGOR_G00190720 [Albula goreensis]
MLFVSGEKLCENTRCHFLHLRGEQLRTVGLSGSRRAPLVGASSQFKGQGGPWLAFRSGSTKTRMMRR